MSHVENGSYSDGICSGNDHQRESIEQDSLFEQRWDCFEDCLLTRWSSFPFFDSEKRLEEAVFIMDVVFGNADGQKRNTMKSRVISLLFRQLSTRLCLSKNQNDQVVNFLKSVMVFIMPENEGISKRILANFGSCQRRAIKDGERNKRLCEKYMEECLYFSIAVDTALFRNEHVISCTGRFSFDDRVLEIPLSSVLAWFLQEMIWRVLFMRSWKKEMPCLKSLLRLRQMEPQTCWESSMARRLTSKGSFTNTAETTTSTRLPCILCGVLLTALTLWQKLFWRWSRRMLFFLFPTGSPTKGDRWLTRSFWQSKGQTHVSKSSHNHPRRDGSFTGMSSGPFSLRQKVLRLLSDKMQTFEFFGILWEEIPKCTGVRYITIFHSTTAS